jgi:hypothetical protein
MPAMQRTGTSSRRGGTGAEAGLFISRAQCPNPARRARAFFRRKTAGRFMIETFHKPKRTSRALP